MTQPDLFAWSPSHEETPAKFLRADDDPRDFTAEWRDFERDHPHVVDYIRRMALLKLQEGAKRISVDALFNDARETMRYSLNNDHRAACARWLLARDARFEGVIRTRAARRTK